jgi:hypothetical protein
LAVALPAGADPALADPGYLRLTLEPAATADAPAPKHLYTFGVPYRWPGGAFVWRYNDAGRPAFNSAKFDPLKVLAVPVGTGTLSFIDGNNALFSYDVGGIAQTRHITREVFGPPGTLCR